MRKTSGYELPKPIDLDPLLGQWVITTTGFEGEVSAVRRFADGAKFVTITNKAGLGIGDVAYSDVEMFERESK